MAVRLKHVSDQVIVIAGATGGIGLTTARMAAGHGAKLVLAARGGNELDRIADELRRRGAQVACVAADPGTQPELARIAMAATERFGRIDTWINNAGISIAGCIGDVSPEDERRLFQASFWAVVHGSLEAVRHMHRRGGGALINLGSELSDRALPLQATYPASRHAVKGFTDALRMRLEMEKAPMSVTLLKPAAIESLPGARALSAPIYAPELVAEAILHAAQHAGRDVLVGAPVRPMPLGRFQMPRLLERYMRAVRSGQLHADAMRCALCPRPCP